MTQKKVDLFRQLSHIYAKLILSGIVALCWVAVLIFIGYLIITDKDWVSIGLVTSLEIVITLAMPQLMKHYFPTNGE
jgi:hypothetical protein